MIKPLLIITSEIEFYKIKKVLRLYKYPKKVALINFSSLRLDNNEIKKYLNLTSIQVINLNSYLRKEADKIGKKISREFSKILSISDIFLYSSYNELNFVDYVWKEFARIKAIDKVIKKNEYNDFIVLGNNHFLNKFIEHNFKKKNYNVNFFYNNRLIGLYFLIRPYTIWISNFICDLFISIFIKTILINNGDKNIKKIIFTHFPENWVERKDKKILYRYIESEFQYSPTSSKYLISISRKNNQWIKGFISSSRLLNKFYKKNKLLRSYDVLEKYFSALDVISVYFSSFKKINNKKRIFLNQKCLILDLVKPSQIKY